MACSARFDFVCAETTYFSHNRGGRYELKDGDIVNVDVSLYIGGAHADLNETFLVGEVDDEGKHLVQTTYEVCTTLLVPCGSGNDELGSLRLAGESKLLAIRLRFWPAASNIDNPHSRNHHHHHQCLEKAIEICRPGTRYREVGNVIEKYARKHNFTLARSFCGHGVGPFLHCSPNVPHYARNKVCVEVPEVGCWCCWIHLGIRVPQSPHSTSSPPFPRFLTKAVGVMDVGHTFTIEPMLCEGTWRDQVCVIVKSLFCVIFPQSANSWYRANDLCFHKHPPFFFLIHSPLSLA